jgi:hypothetical protein
MYRQVPENNALHYAIGEVYSGARQDNFEEKLDQVETRLRMLRRRRERRDNILPLDSTQIEDSAFFAFVAVREVPPRTTPRFARETTRLTSAMVAKPTQWPLLSKLAAAGRFLLVVVPFGEYPLTSICIGQHKLQLTVQRGFARMQHVQGQGSPRRQEPGPGQQSAYPPINQGGQGRGQRAGDRGQRAKGGFQQRGGGGMQRPGPGQQQQPVYPPTHRGSHTQRGGGGGDGRKCLNCGGIGHVPAVCPSRRGRGR